MAKKQSGKKSAKVQRGKSGSTVKEFINKHLVLILGTSVIVLSVAMVFLFWGINRYNTQQAINDQRKQFDAAEASLDALYAQIVKEVGQPTKVEKDKSCSYASAKLDKGQLRCGSSYSLQYSLSEATAANILRKKASSVVEAYPSMRITYIRNADFENNNLAPSDNYQAFDIQLVPPSPLGCYLTIRFLEKDLDSYPIVENSHVRIATGCYGDAKSEFYPVRD